MNLFISFATVDKNDRLKNLELDNNLIITTKTQAF